MMTSDSPSSVEPLPKDALRRAYKQWLRGTPEGREEQKKMNQRIVDLQEKWDRKGL